MRATNSLARWGLAACLIGGSAGLLQSQDTGFSKDLKIRLGYATSTKDDLRHYYQGFGLNLGYGVGPGKIGLELGYFYNTGDPYITTPDATRISAGLQAVNTARMIEDKRNELAGFTVRASWQQKINETWDWQAGLQIGTKFKHQYVADVQSDTTSTGTAWRDLYNGTPQEGGFNVSPYAGVNWKIDKDSSFEINVMLLRYKAIEYRHYAGTGSYDSAGTTPGVSDPTVPWPYDKLEKNDRLVPHLEIAYVFHF